MISGIVYKNISPKSKKLTLINAVKRESVMKKITDTKKKSVKKSDEKSGKKFVIRYRLTLSIKID